MTGLKVFSAAKMNHVIKYLQALLRTVEQPDVLAERLALDRYLILDLPFSEEEKTKYFVGLKNFFFYAHSNKEK